jgi:hypothetical protein
MESTLGCKFKTGDWVRIKNQAVKMKVAHATPKLDPIIPGQFQSQFAPVSKGCTYICLLPSGLTKPFTEEDLEFWDQELNTDPSNADKT